MDWQFTNQILEALNNGTLVSPPVQLAEFPGLGDLILDFRSESPLTVDRAEAQRLLNRELPGSETTVKLGVAELEEIGLSLVPRTAFGVLNGGMATSYADTKKNRAFGPELFELWKPSLDAAVRNFGHLPKGITPGFFQKDGTPGPTYLELKLRHLALLNLAAREAGHTGPGMKLFQMTSASTDAPLREAWPRLKESPALSELLGEYPIDLADSPTAVQDLVGTFALAPEGLSWRVFEVEKQGQRVPYALPAGHGQNFRVLRTIYEGLKSQGYRYVYLGNIDNLGYLPSLRGLAVLELLKRPAAFDFCFKTPLDVKGGVLYRQPDGRLNCADIGVALDVKRVQEAETAGTPILFNCATGLFDLDYLCANLDRILELLPVRVSDQDKDIGRYSQAEQVTWEVIGLIDRPLIYGVEKRRRFLAAKLLMDCFLSSGLLDERHAKMEGLQSYLRVSQVLNGGLDELLEGPLGFERKNGLWKPIKREALLTKIRQSWQFLAV
ncbi:MAG: UTP--glucose-1-phosphate uridylyltransferase [Spirochaetales bacterium]